MPILDFYVILSQFKCEVQFENGSSSSFLTLSFLLGIEFSSYMWLMCHIIIKGCQVLSKYAIMNINLDYKEK